MTTSRYAILIAVGISIFTAGCKRAVDRSPIIATVNGNEIRRTDFDRFFSFKLGELKTAELNDLLKSQMLDEFITRRVVLDEAKKLGLSVSDAEIGQAVEQDPQMKSNMSAADARAEFANDLLVTKYYKQYVLKDVRLSPEEAQRYIDQHKSQLTEKPGFNVREIRVDSREEAETLRREVTEGHKDFTLEVRQHSLVPNAEQGGLTHYQEGQLPDVLEKAVQPLRPGDISPVIESSFGFHIFKLESRTQPHTPDDRRAQVDDSHSRLIEEAIERKNQEAVDEAIQRLMSAATITVNPGVAGFTYAGKLMHN